MGFQWGLEWASLILTIFCWFYHMGLEDRLVWVFFLTAVNCGFLALLELVNTANFTEDELS
jgi:hypothetical protein